MKPLVIYHANCADGFGAAFAAWLRLGDSADYVACRYGEVTTPADFDMKVSLAAKTTTSPSSTSAPARSDGRLVRVGQARRLAGSPQDGVRDVDRGFRKGDRGQLPQGGAIH
ncbi:MAG: hypothetical protein IPM06_21840 [Rhizobiales bacterium]|nr:hypothetical protein [Hyphomicrobiales bacterium]